MIGGRGEMWRRQGGREEVVTLEPGVCVTIPVGTAFQFRSSGPDALAAVAVTMPPWPGDDEAQPAQGRWASEVDVQPKGPAEPDQLDCGGALAGKLGWV